MNLQLLTSDFSGNTCSSLRLALSSFFFPRRLCFSCFKRCRLMKGVGPGLLVIWPECDFEVDICLNIFFILVSLYFHGPTIN